MLKCHRFRSAAQTRRAPPFSISVYTLYSDRRSVAARRAQSAELQKVLADLRGIATNINQLTMKANVSGHVIAGTDDAVAAVGRLEDRLADAIEGFR